MNNDNHFSRELSKYIFGFLNYKIYLKTKKLDLVVQSYNLSTGEAGPGELYSETFLKCCAYFLSLLSMWQDNQHHGNTPLHMSIRVPWERFNWVPWEDPPWMWAGTILVVWLPRPGEHKNGAEHNILPLSASWLQLQCDQQPPAPRAMTSQTMMDQTLKLSE